MANGDAAAAAGLDTVPGTSDLRQGYSEDNKSRDYLAEHMTTGTHLASAIVGPGTIDVARIPVLTVDQIPALDHTRIPPLDASKITSGILDPARLPAISAAADGPTSAAYNRSATGSGWVAVYMNAQLQFMRSTSSRRYKHNIRAWSGSIRGLRTVIFDRRGNDTPVDEVGFIAEEVLETLPEAVAYFDDKIDGIHERVILAAVVAELQTALDAIDDLTTRMAQLERSAE